MNEVVLRYGNTDLNIYDGYDLTKSSQEVTYSDLTCEFTGHSAEELPERYQEAKIIEKQKVNQEVETIQYEEKNKIKEATFDSEINENLVVDKVYGSTSQETREESKSVLTGSEIVVNDTYIDNKTQFVVDGNSEQETTEGYNLCYSTTISSNNLYFQIDKNTISNKTMTISFITDKDLTYNTIYLNITNSDDTKENPVVGYINGNANTRVKLTFTLSDEVYSKVQSAKSIFFYIYKANAGFSTLEQAQINLGNDKNYEPYTVGIPSPNPDYPQEIEVIGDNINIFNKSASMYSVGAAKTELDTGVRLTQTVAGNYKYCWLTLGQSELLGKTLTMQAKIFSSAQNISGLSLFYGNASTGAVVNSGYGLSSNGGNITFSILSTFPDNCDRVNLLLYVNVAGIGNIDDYVDFTDLKIEIGDKATLYSNYNSGSVGLEQSGINKLGLTNGTLRNGSGITVKELENGGISITGTASSDTNFQYIWKLKNIVKNNQLITLSNGTTGVTGLQVSLRDSSKNVISETWTNNGAVKSATLTTDAYYYQIQINSNITVNTTIYPMIVEGAYSETTLPAYEPYREKIIPIDLQGNTLAKVGNVKDILKVNRNGEVKIEKNIGKVVLDGSENWKLYKTYLYTIIDDCALSPTISTKVATLLSDKFTATSLNDISNNANYGIAYNAFGDREQQKGVCFNVNDYFNSVATLKTWLPNNNVEVYYKLATPQIITLPSISPIELEQGTNIFKLISNLDTTMELTYNYISAMPSTETPSKINNAESINIKIQNENLFDEKFFTDSGFLRNDNDYYYGSATDLLRYKKLPNSFNENTQYIISFNAYDPTITNGRGLFFEVKYTDNSKYNININSSSAKDYMYISDSNKTIDSITCLTGGFGTETYIKNFSIIKGTTAKSYIEHKEQNIPFSLDKPLYQNCYLAEDGIHYKKIQIELDGTTDGLKVTNVTKHSNDIYYCVVPTAKKGINGVNNLYCSHFKAAFGVEIGQCYVTGAGSGIVFILNDQTITTPKAANDWLAEQKEAGNPVTIEYGLATEEIVPYTENRKRSWKNLQKLISYTGKNYVESTADIDIKCPTKIKKEIIPKIYEKLLFTGYVDDYSFNEMREKDVDIDINITLYSPMKMTTLRTATAVGTYELKSLIQKEILSPLIDDGFSIEELDITDRQLTVNYISETIEYCMNNLSNKFNFWWFIDEQKRIYIKDIDKLMNGEPDYIYDDTHSIAGLQYIKPITESDNYANVVNFKNVRIYEYSRLQLNGNTITQEHNPLISQQITTIKNGEQLDFNFPCDIKKENIIKSAESNGITQYFYGIYVKGTYSDNTTFEFSIGYDDINKTFETTDNVGFDGSENATEEFLLIRDSFFSNLITGFKLNNENKSIKSIEKITSDSALIWNVNKLYNDKAIADKRGIISKTGIVETTIDMNESWKTIQELREIGVSYMNKNSLDLNGTIELCTDRNVFQIGKTIYINKMLVNGTYIITQIKESLSNNDIDYYITAKNANMLDNYIDVFRGEASQESSDKTYQVYITHYEEENMYERHEVVQ
jgi:hypothetical protein